MATRKPKDPGKMPTGFTITLPIEMVQEIDKIAHSRGMSRNKLYKEMSVRAIRRYKAKAKSA